MAVHSPTCIVGSAGDGYAEQKMICASSENRTHVSSATTRYPVWIPGIVGKNPEGKPGKTRKNHWMIEALKPNPGGVVVAHMVVETNHRNAENREYLY